MARKYENKILGYGDIMKADDFKKSVKQGYITEDDGSGYWAKDEKESEDNVFDNPQEDATHVIWYNK